MFLLSFITKIFHFLPEEISHHLALKGLKMIHSIGLLRLLIGNRTLDNNISNNPNDLRSLENKLGLAAGLDKNGEYIDCLSALGIGFLEVGTVTPVKQDGNPKPRLFRNRKNKSLLNRLGFNNNGVEALVANLKKKNSNITLGVSIGKNFHTPNERAFKDYLFCMEKVYPHSNYIALNISSPNTKDLRKLSDVETLEDLLMKIKEKQNKLSQSFKYVPVFVKISPDENEEALKHICECIMKCEIDGIISSNTTIKHNDINGYGGLSGMPLKDEANKKLIFIKKLVGNQLPIIASGGVMSASDFKEKINAGADLVQVYTGFIFEGPKLIQEILDLGSS
jgi:dihydroorotate dehydrogenase